jgi:23S rRNA (uracil1939-C5)-methyltransferase
MPACPHRPPCPGCPRFDAVGWPPRARERLGALADRAGLPAPALHAGPPLGWRHRARLAVRGRARSPKIGLFQAGSHRIVDTPRCPIHHPLVNRIAADLRAAVRATATEPYRESGHRGLLRYVQIVVERRSGRAQVVLVCNDDTPDTAKALAERLRAETGDALHSLWWNGNPSPHNVILGPHWTRLAGPEAVCESIAGVDVFYPPDAFGQANLPLADRLVEDVVARAAGSARVVDLYAGAGAFGLPLLARGARVHFAERAAGGLRGLELGIAARPPDERARARVHAGDAAAGDALARAIDAADAVILDPPRRGADDALIERLAAHPPERIVYVSCGWPAFVAQAERLLDGGRLALTRLDAWALLPQTEHVETVACFERR